MVKIATKLEDIGDPQSFVISKNLHRRHLNETQRAVVASKLANMPLGGATYRSANLHTETKMPKHLHKTDMQICTSQPEAAKQLNETQRMIVAKKLANMNRGNYSKSANLPITPITQADAAKQLNVSERGIRMVNEVERRLTGTLQSGRS